MCYFVFSSFKIYSLRRKSLEDNFSWLLRLKAKEFVQRTHHPEERRISPMASKGATRKKKKISKPKKFQNPDGYWEHHGTFLVELTPRALIARVPRRGTTIKGHSIHVRRGHIKQTIGGIQLRAGAQPFYLRYSYIRCIRDSEGALIWQNLNYSRRVSSR